MFPTEAHAASASAPVGGAFMQFLPLVVLLVVFYFLLIRPQQKRAKEHQATLDALRAGDAVVTSGGVYGTVVKIDGDVVTLQCSEKCRLKVVKRSISGKVDPRTMEGE